MRVIFLLRTQTFAPRKSTKDELLRDYSSPAEKIPVIRANTCTTIEQLGHWRLVLSRASSQRYYCGAELFCLEHIWPRNLKGRHFHEMRSDTTIFENIENKMLGR